VPPLISELIPGVLVFRCPKCSRLRVAPANPGHLRKCASTGWPKCCGRDALLCVELRAPDLDGSERRSVDPSADTAVMPALSVP
jgi:hypothetical protein